MCDASKMKAIIREVVQNLQEIAPLERIWTRGAVHPGGPHYRVRGTRGPISIGEDECAAFGRLIQEFTPDRCFIIGNAFGLSSVFIAKMMELHGGQSVVTLDNHSEGSGHRCAGIAERLAARLDCRLLENVTGTSPDDIARSAGGYRYDLILIDGLHRHPQATRDFRGVLCIARPDTIFCWHDYWMPGIPQSVDEASRAGCHCRKINSSCEMVFGTRNGERFSRIVAMYDNAEQPRKRLRPRAFIKLCYVLMTGTINARRALPG